MTVKVGRIYKSSGINLSSGGAHILQKTYQFKVTSLVVGGSSANGGQVNFQYKAPTSKSWINGGWCYGLELASISATKADLSVEIEEIKKEINSKEKEIDILNTKITFLEESGLEEYCEDTYKVFVALTTIENKKLSKLEKAKVIGDLING